MSVPSDAINSRVEAIAPSTSLRCDSSAFEPIAQLGVFLDREWIARAELVEPPTQAGQL